MHLINIYIGTRERWEPSRQLLSYYISCLSSLFVFYFLVKRAGNRREETSRGERLYKFFDPVDYKYVLANPEREGGRETNWDRDELRNFFLPIRSPEVSSSSFPHHHPAHKSKLLSGSNFVEPVDLLTCDGNGIDNGCNWRVLVSGCPTNTQIEDT